LASTLLTSCAQFSLFANKPSIPPTPPSPTQPVCPGALQADLPAKPQPDAKAGFPRPQSKRGGDAVQLYLLWLRDYMTWAELGWQRA